MYQSNATEMLRERQATLLREAEDRRLARRLRAARQEGRHRSERRTARFGRATALWGRVSILFFGS
jgi:hypothetical protein